MKSWLFLFIFCGLTIRASFGEEVKKDHFPCMAFLYYHDAAVKNPLYEHKRFLQNAILIKPEFLLTASIIEPPAVNNKFNGFPHKTLLARIGAISVDETLQYNEDENEQEREIVQVIRPFHYNHHVWWKSDISVLKSVTPFNVKFITFPILYGNTDTDCTMLTFVKNNLTMERQLMKYDFRVLQSSQCGTDFYEATMICGEFIYDSPPPDYCEGNSGGPLMCSERLVGLQTFTNSECKSPYLFQSLPKWQKFITCSISQTCHEDECSTTCSVSYKDVIENSKENQVLPKEGEEIKETLNVIPAEVTESDEAEVTRTSAQPVYTFKSTSYAPTIIITSDNFRKNFDSSESLDKSKENEDGDSESMTVTGKTIDLGDKGDSSENKNDHDHSGNDLSLDAPKTDDTDESLKGKNVHKIEKSDDVIERRDENALKIEEKTEERTEEKMANEKSGKMEDEADESAEADKSEDGTGTTYALVTKGLTKISFKNIDHTFPPTTTKTNQMPTTSAPIPTPLSADVELGNAEKENDAPGGEKSFELSGRSHESSGESSHEGTGQKNPNVSGEKSQEASKEVNAERRIDGSGESVISVETATSGDKSGASAISVETATSGDKSVESAEKRNEGSGENSDEGSGEKNSEKTRKSADGLDLNGEITADSTGDKTNEKIERRDNNDLIENAETRRKVVSGKLFPPTVSDQILKTNITTSTTTTNATPQFKTKEEEPDLRAYSHGTKISYATALIASVCLDICIVSIFKFNY